jgi:hypothetical protein
MNWIGSRHVKGRREGRPGKSERSGAFAIGVLERESKNRTYVSALEGCALPLSYSRIETFVVK